ncbi:MAG TPA: 30S ribosomal protein S6 [Nitrospiria bacterium]|nr:30S ribosomal protein S6 [Nitrospiria bacterium]
MNFYESIFIARPSLTDEEVNKFIEKIKSIIEQGGGTVLITENWGKKKLAYEVEKEKKGTYIFLYFQSEGKLVSDVERAYRLDDAVMKYLTVKLDKKDLAQREWARKRANLPVDPEGRQERVSVSGGEGVKGGAAV